MATKNREGSKKTIQKDKKVTREQKEIQHKEVKEKSDREVAREANPYKQQKKMQKEELKNKRAMAQARADKEKELKAKVKELKKEKEKIDEQIENARKETEKFIKLSKSAANMEETRNYTKQAHDFYEKQKEWEEKGAHIDDELKQIDRRLNAAHYARETSYRAYAEEKRSRAGVGKRFTNFITRLWRSTFIYKMYDNVRTAILERSTKQSSRSVLEQYDEVRKSNRIALAITRASVDVSHDVEECLNNSEKSEAQKIEELAEICGKSKATIVAQLDDNRVVQFEFHPSMESPNRKGTIELSTRNILQDTQGKTFLGKPELINTVDFDKAKMHSLLNFSDEKQDKIKLALYGTRHPDRTEAMLQVADPDITKAVRNELEAAVTAANEWDPKADRANAEAIANAEREKRDRELIERRKADAEKPEQQRAYFQVHDGKDQEIPQKDTVAKENIPVKEPPHEKKNLTKPYEKPSDFVNGRIDLQAITPEEKQLLQKDLISMVKSDNSFTISTETEVLGEKAILSKLGKQDFIYQNNKLYDQKTGKEVLESLGDTTRPLTLETIKSDAFIEKAYNVIQEQANKNEKQIDSLLAGEKFPENNKDYEKQVTTSLKSEILRTGDTRTMPAEVNPISVNSKRELVERIRNGEVSFAKDLSQEGKTNRILVDRETGAQLVCKDEKEMTRTWTEHDFSEKSFIRSVQKESAQIAEQSKEVQKNEEVVQNESEERTEQQKNERTHENDVSERDHTDFSVKSEPIMPTAGIRNTRTSNEKDECINLQQEKGRDYSDDDIKNMLEYTDFDKDGFLLNSAGEKIMGEDGAYTIDDLRAIPNHSYEEAQQTYSQAYGHEFTDNSEAVVSEHHDANQNIPHVEDEQQIENEIEFDHTDDRDLYGSTYDGYSYNSDDAVMNPVTIHDDYCDDSHDDLGFVDNNHDGVDDRYEER